ncbi:hypothetical protein HGRIS_010592 [Hohenbuehelia grisea]|uniref:Uncharacterized protein n=1 Tax=Hohenbuehelia grisea TaxID=104357 RepID=A0ABR3IXP2_9AGAR
MMRLTDLLRGRRSDGGGVEPVIVPLGEQRKRHFAGKVLIIGNDAQAISAVLKSLRTQDLFAMEQEEDTFADIALEVAACSTYPTNQQEDIAQPEQKLHEDRFRLKTGMWGPGEIFDLHVIHTALTPSTLQTISSSSLGDVDLVGFIAPVDGFDEVCPHSPSKQKLQSVFELWTSVVSNPIFVEMDFVLFMTNCDTLATKLSSGIQFRDFVVSFRSVNDPPTVLRYIQSKFRDTHGKHTVQHDPHLEYRAAMLRSYLISEATSLGIARNLVKDIRDHKMRSSLTSFQLA